MVFSLQDETDLSDQKIDAAAVAAACEAAGIKYVRLGTSDIGKRRRQGAAT